jgi:type I restriction enzyme R subunit
MQTTKYKRISNNERPHRTHSIYELGSKSIALGRLIHVHEANSAKAALTELFIEMKTNKTPAVVERIVTDIDNIVKYVRFDDWQDSTLGEREVKRELRKIIWVKYQIKDEELFNRAYDYIKGYY